MAPGRAEEELAHVDGAAGDVAADKVRVHIFERARRKDAARENAIAKAGGETFDLGFEHWQHVYRGAVGHVAVSPSDVFARGSAGGIEERRLREEDERALRMTAVAHIVFRCGDFLEGAAEMDGGGAGTLGRLPGNGSVQGVIDFEDARAVAESCELVSKPRRKAIASDTQELMRRYVTQDRIVVFKHR